MISPSDISLSRPIALVGMMGVGKTTIGRRLAGALGVDFVDSDEEIETASGRTIAGYFKDYGEAEFRRGEFRVIERLLDGAPMVLGTGGGAFIQDTTRALIKSKAISIWLRADIDTLMDRVLRKSTRPLLMTDDPRATMEALLKIRNPIYAEADIVIDSDDGSHTQTVSKILETLDVALDDLLA